MTTVNQKGGFTKRISILRNHDDESTTMLKTVFLKKTQNYVLQLTDFFTNLATPINLDSGVLFAIRRLPHLANQTDPPPFPNHYRQRDYEFTGKFHSAMVFVQQLQRFFHKFGYIFYNYGIPNLTGFRTVLEQQVFEFDSNIINNAQIPTTNLNFTSDFMMPVNGVQTNVGWSQSLNEGNFVNASITSDNRLSFTLDPIFFSNFYIEVSPIMQGRFGLPPQIFCVSDLAGNITTHDNSILFTNADVFIDETTNRYNPLTEFRMTSQFSLDELDDRLSLDVICTFPNSNKISVLNGQEEHEYVLGRFVLNDYKKFETVMESDSDGITGKITIRENMFAGLENLTRGNANMATNFLLPGEIQLIKLKLMLRYFLNGKIISKSPDVGNAYWYLTLLFSKKV